MSTASRSKKPVMAVVILVIIVVAAVGVYFATQTTSPSATTMMSTSSAAGMRDTLVIDDAFWPSGDLNQLTSPQAIPYPDWLTYTVYQSLVTTNASAEYGPGTVQILPMLATDWSVSRDGNT